MKLKYGPYSPSRLETASCGYEFQQSYIVKRPENKVERLPQARGSTVHEIFEKITGHMINSPGVSLSAETLRTWTNESLNKHPLAYQEIDAISDMVQKYLRKPPTNLTKNSEIELKLAVKPVLDEKGNLVEYDDVMFSGLENEYSVKRVRF